MPVLRQAVAEKYQKSHWDGYTADHVMVTGGAMEGLMPVSYTHLDVYKRQGASLASAHAAGIATSTSPARIW